MPARRPGVKARPAPLAGITVLDFSQFLAGPVAALRLADLGARVIKVERPPGGDIGRQLAFAGASKDGDTISFHAMNRNKESLAADLKDDEDLSIVRRMISSADVMIENFRPGVMKRLGLDYGSVRKLNPRIIYGSISGYGPDGPWAGKPGQDLLAQAVSGLPWANGSASGPPVAVGLSIADHLASCQLALGIAALLVRRERTGEGGIVETSLLEGVLDFQFELLTAFFTMPGFQTRRGRCVCGQRLPRRPLRRLPDFRRLPRARHGLGNEDRYPDRARSAGGVRRPGVLDRRAGNDRWPARGATCRARLHSTGSTCSSRPTSGARPCSRSTPWPSQKHSPPFP